MNDSLKSASEELAAALELIAQSNPETVKTPEFKKALVDSGKIDDQILGLRRVIDQLIEFSMLKEIPVCECGQPTEVIYWGSLAKGDNRIRWDSQCVDQACGKKYGIIFIASSDSGHPSMQFEDSFPLIE